MTRIRQLVAAMMLFTIAIAWTLDAQAQSPVISYQGVISTPEGNPLDASQCSLAVTIYADEAGTQAIWHDTYQTPVAHGVFSIALGSNTPLPAPQLLDRPLWLGVTVAGGKEMRPLSPVAASAYALNIADNAVTTSKIADNAVTTEKLGTDYVASVSLNGQKLTGKGTALNIVTGNGLAATVDPATSDLIFSLTRSANSNGNSKGARTQSTTGDPIALWNQTTSLPYAGPSAANNNEVLHGGPPTLAPTWSLVNLTSDVSNTLPFASGGTATPGGVIAAKWSNTEAGGNTASGNNAVVAGGTSNSAISYGATVGGGSTNTAGTTTDVNAKYQTVGGGWQNQAIGDDAAIGGGENNRANSYESTVAGGSGNVAGTTLSVGVRAFVGGGTANTAAAQESAIAGGFTNTAGGAMSAIGGGQLNRATGQNSFVGGGWGNLASGTTGPGVATVGGGYGNTAAGGAAFIGGGNGNNANGNCDIVVGGYQNTASSAVYGFANVPGGVGLRANGDAETVIGAVNFYNTAGTNAHDIWLGPNNDRIFEIGSPFIGQNNSNAFEVTYNGQSIVYHKNGGSSVVPPTLTNLGNSTVFQGATNTESPVYAWGEYDPSTNTLKSDYGVSQVVPVPGLTGVFMVSLCPKDPHGLTLTKSDIQQASVTITVVNDNIDDITSPPPPPPPSGTFSIQPGPQSQGTISMDSMRKLIGVPDSVPNPSIYPPEPIGTAGPQAAAQPDAIGCYPPANVNCGYATASTIGILEPGFGALYQFSFIVRTFLGVPNGLNCNQACLPFYFKVCHR